MTRQTKELIRYCLPGFIVSFLAKRAFRNRKWANVNPSWTEFTDSLPDEDDPEVTVFYNDDTDEKVLFVGAPKDAK